MKRNDVFITLHNSLSSLGIDSDEIMSNLKKGDISFCNAGVKYPFNHFKIDLNDKFYYKIENLLITGLGPIAEKLKGKRNIPVFLSTSTGGISNTEDNYNNISYDIFSNHFFDLLSNSINLSFPEMFSPLYTLSTACSSSGHALIHAHKFIENNVIDNALVVGIDTLSLTTFYGFNSLKLISPSICNPFSEDRDGLSLGEGFGALFLEKEPSFAPISKIIGTASTSDGHHISSPDPEGKSQKECILKAVSQSNTALSDIGYINAHGTGTVINDVTEYNVIKSIFNKNVKMSSLKGFIGHTLGASALTEISICLTMLKNNVIYVPPSLKNTLDAEIIPDTNFISNAKYFLKNSFGFGGNNVSLLFELY